MSGKIPSVRIDISTLQKSNTTKNFKATWSWSRLLWFFFVFINFNFCDILFHDLIYSRLNRFRHWKGLHFFDWKIQRSNALFLGIFIFYHSSIQNGFLIPQCGHRLQKLMSAIKGHKLQSGGIIFHFMTFWWWMGILLLRFFWRSVYTFACASQWRFVTSRRCSVTILSSVVNLSPDSSTVFSLQNTSTEGIYHAIFAPFFSGAKLKSGLGQGLLAKIRNRKEIRNMAHSKK